LWGQSVKFPRYLKKKKEDALFEWKEHPSKHSFQTRPGPRPGFWVLTGSPVVQVNSFFNQNDVILVKKKSQRVATGSCRVNRVTPGFSFPYFFFNPARFQPRVGRIDPPGRVRFQNYASKCTMNDWWGLVFF
jgi:hypothetical protein